MFLEHKVHYLDHRYIIEIVEYLSDILNNFFNSLRDIPLEEKKEFGKEINFLKKAVNDKILELKFVLDSVSEKKQINDLTRPGLVIDRGTRHPLSIVKKRIISIFSSVRRRTITFLIEGV